MFDRYVMMMDVVYIMMKSRGVVSVGNILCGNGRTVVGFKYIYMKGRGKDN